MPEPNLPPPDADKFIRPLHEMEDVPLANKGAEILGRGPIDTPPWLPVLRPAERIPWYGRLPSVNLGWARPGEALGTPRWHLGNLTMEPTQGCGCSAVAAAGLAIGWLVVGGLVSGLCHGPEVSLTSGTTAGPELSSITATFADTATTYRVTLTPESPAFKFSWSNTNSCGTFTQSGPQAIWDHPSPTPLPAGYCPAKPFPHPGEIQVVATDGRYTCTATYLEGSAAGTGAPGSCSGQVAGAAPRAPVTPPTPNYALWFGVPAVLLVGFGAWAVRQITPLSRGGRAVAADPCAAEKAWVAQCEARLKALEDELAQTLRERPIPNAQLPDLLRKSIATQTDLLRTARANLARCLGTPIPGEMPGPGPSPAGGPTPGGQAQAQSGDPAGAGGGPVASPPQIPTPPTPPTPPPTPHAPPPPPQLHAPCTDGETMPPDVKCEAEGDLLFLSKAKIEVDGAYTFGQEDIDAALQGLDAALDAIDVGTGLISALTAPGGTILGILGLPSFDSTISVPRDAARQGLEDLNKKFKGLRRWGRWRVTVPEEHCRFSCVWQEVCRNGNWVSEKGIHLKREGKARPHVWEEDVFSPQDAQRFLTRLTALVTQRNKDTEARFDKCAAQCK